MKEDRQTRTWPARRVLAAALAGLALGIGAVGCGGGDEGDATGTTTTETETTTEPTEAGGRSIFVANCGSCHTLSDAGTGGTVGPVLDGLGLSSEQVETQVREGGTVMPSFEGTLTDEEIAEVSAYVAAASSG